MMSQGAPAFTPDFITPADAQFAVNPNFDPGCEKENLLRGDRPSPCTSPPCAPSARASASTRAASRRTRNSASGLSPRGFSGGSQGYGLAREPERLVAALGVVPRRRAAKTAAAAPDAVFRVPAPRAPAPPARASIPRAAQSLRVARNPFLPAEEQRGGSRAGAARARTAPRTRRRTRRCPASASISSSCGVVGRGGFCKVIKVISRLDGAEYAVKRTERKLQSERERRRRCARCRRWPASTEARTAAATRRALLRVLDGVRPPVHPARAVRHHAQRGVRGVRRVRARESMDAETSGGDVPRSLAGTERRKRKRLARRKSKKCCATSHVGAGVCARVVAHLDVKPDNVLVRDGVYKLADWGRAAKSAAAAWENRPAPRARAARGFERRVSVEEGEGAAPTAERPTVAKGFAILAKRGRRARARSVNEGGARRTRSSAWRRGGRVFAGRDGGLASARASARVLAAYQRFETDSRGTRVRVLRGGRSRDRLTIRTPKAGSPKARAPRRVAPDVPVSGREDGGRVPGRAAVRRRGARRGGEMDAPRSRARSPGWRGSRARRA